MTAKTRNGLAWGASVLVHVLMFAVVIVGGGGASAGPELYEVGIAELPGRSQPLTAPPEGDPEGTAVKSSARPVPDLAERTPAKVKAGKPANDRHPLQATPASSSSAGLPNGSRARPTGETPGKAVEVPVAGGGPGGSQGQGRGEGPGSGEGFVLNRPVYYPKNVQNEGKEGTVRVMVTLSLEGAASAELIASSGDERLDRYALRAVTEAWQYTRPDRPVRIYVSIVFSNGKVEVAFEKSEYLSGGGGTP